MSHPSPKRCKISSSIDENEFIVDNDVFNKAAETVERLNDCKVFADSSHSFLAMKNNFLDYEFQHSVLLLDKMQDDTSLLPYMLRISTIYTKHKDCMNALACKVFRIHLESELHLHNFAKNNCLLTIHHLLSSLNSDNSLCKIINNSLQEIYNILRSTVVSKSEQIECSSIKLRLFENALIDIQSNRSYGIPTLEMMLEPRDIRNRNFESNSLFNTLLPSLKFLIQHTPLFCNIFMNKSITYLMSLSRNIVSELTSIVEYSYFTPSDFINSLKCLTEIVSRGHNIIDNIAQFLIRIVSDEDIYSIYEAEIEKQAIIEAITDFYYLLPLTTDIFSCICKKCLQFMVNFLNRYPFEIDTKQLQIRTKLFLFINKYCERESGYINILQLGTMLYDMFSNYFYYTFRAIRYCNSNNFSWTIIYWKLQLIAVRLLSLLIENDQDNNYSHVNWDFAIYCLEDTLEIFKINCKGNELLLIRKLKKIVDR